jgi:plastocyanin
MRRLTAVAALLVATIVLCGPSLRTQQTPHHEFSVTARRYAFEPATLDVHQGDLIRITLRTQDIPHSFVIDALRITRKATPEHAVTFELFVDRTGVFPFYCNLTLEDGCRDMRGQLVVRTETVGSTTGPTPSHEDVRMPRNISLSRHLVGRFHRRLPWKFAKWPEGTSGIGVAPW